MNSLSIRLSADGFSFSTGGTHVEHYPVNAGYSLTANLKEMLARTDTLQHPYPHPTILTETDRFTVVPNALMEDEQMDALFYQNFGKTHNEIVLCNELMESGVTVVFGMDKHAHQWLTEHFADAQFFATVSPLIEHFGRKASGGGKRMYAHLREPQMEAMVFDTDRQLLLANAYPCTHTPDRLYYLLYIWEQLGLDADRDTLVLTGELREKQELLEGIRPFIRHASWEETEGGVPYDMRTLMEFSV
jgi:hypothetical protein